MTTIVDSPIVLEESPRKLVLRVRHGVEFFTYFLGGIVMLGIAIAIFSSEASNIYGFLCLILGSLILLGGFQTASTRATTLYTFDLDRDLLIVQQEGTVKRSPERYSLDNLTVELESQTTGTYNSSTYYTLELKTNPGADIPALDFSNSRGADRIESLILQYLQRR